MSEPQVKRSDWVECKATPGWVGFVKRMARDGSWADVLWKDKRGDEWTKRMKASALKVVTRIRGKMDDVEFEAVDATREEELKR